MCVARKNTLLAWSDAGLSAYAAAKTRTVSRDIQNLDSKIDRIGDISSTNLISTFAVYELLESQGKTLRSLLVQMQEFSKSLQQISGYLDEKRNKEELLGKSRILVLGIQKELIYIKEIMGNFPEFAILQLEHLKNFIEENDICITNFQHSSFDELQKIDEILSSIDSLHQKLIMGLGD